jgi:hypothetical protein
VVRLQNTDDALLVICTDTRDDANPLLVRPEAIGVPPLSGRADELPRIVDEFAADAIAELRPLRDGFTAADRAWVLAHAAISFAEIEKATLRLVALRGSRNMSSAAQRLGMAPVSLARWIYRRRQPPTRSHGLMLEDRSKREKAGVTVEKIEAEREAGERAAPLEARKLRRKRRRNNALFAHPGTPRRATSRTHDKAR